MNKLKIGVVGLGHLGKLHLKMFSQIEGCQLTSLYDTNPEILAAVSSEYKVAAAESLKDLIDRTDAVSVAATTSAHYDICKECMHNHKHVFVEKPITARIDEAEELVQIANENNLVLQVGHIERFNPALIALEKYIIKPMFIQTDRLAQFNPRGTDVAVVLDLMIHDIDVILSLVKSEVKKIDASGVAVVSDNVDIANARIEFENGAVANVTSSRISQKKMRKMRIFQKDTYIAVDFITGVSEIYRLIPIAENTMAGSISFGEIGIGEKKRRIVYEQAETKELNALQYELQLFVDSILTNSKPVVSGEDGLKALKVADIILKKIEESRI